MSVLQRNIGPAVGLKAYPRTAVVAMANHRRHGGDRHDTRGKNGSANQGIDPGRFATLELTNKRDIEPALRDSLGHGASIAGGVLRAKLVGDRSEPQEYRIAQLGTALASFVVVTLWP